MPQENKLRQLYVEQQRSPDELSVRYRVGKPTIRRWLVQAGIEIRSPGSGGYRRQLIAPPASVLAELGRTLPTPAIVENSRISNGTVLRWFAPRQG